MTKFVHVKTGGKYTMLKDDAEILSVYDIFPKDDVECWVYCFDAEWYISNVKLDIKNGERLHACFQVSDPVLAETEQHGVVYIGEDGRIWCRPSKEFYDGRFEPNLVCLDTVT